MRFPQSYVLQNQLPTGTIAASGAAGTVIAHGNALDSGLCACDSLAALVTLTPGTSTLTMSVQWQVNNAGTWINCPPSNGAAAVVLATASSNSPVTAYIPAPGGMVAGSRQVRLAVLGGVTTAVGGTTDTVAVAYEYRAPVSAFGS